MFQTARAAINNLTLICGGTNHSDNHLIKRFLSGIFTLRPNLPKYNEIWDTNTVLSYLGKMENTTLIQLSCKLCTLFLLLTAQRCQTLHLIEIDDIELHADFCVIHPNHILKQTKPGHHLEKIILKTYHQNPNQCVVKTFIEYLQRTKFLRGNEKKLLISTQKPHKPVSKQTVSRWVTNVLIKAGVNVKYGVHSTMSAATSAAKLGGVSLQTIVKTAGWKNSAAFAKFYDKNITSSNESMQAALLERQKQLK